MALSNRAKKEFLEMVRLRRDEARGALVREEFDQRLNLTDDYMRGKQWPKGYDQDKKNRNPFYVVNQLADILDRLAAMLGLGNLETKMRARAQVDERLMRMKEDRFNLLKEMSDMSGVIFDNARNVASYGFGGVRGYVDPHEMVSEGGRIGFEVVHPAQILVDPRARDPRDPLMGSSYAFYETLTPKWELMARFEDYGRRINEMDPRQPALDGDATGFDPVRNLDGAFESGGSRLRDGTELWSPVSPTNSMGGKDDGYVRETEFHWKAIQPVVYNGVPMNRSIWYRSTIAGDMDGEDGGVVLDVQPNWYGRPNLVLCQGWTRSDSPYSSGLLDRAGELQNVFNSVLSATIKILHESARLQGVFLTGVNALDEDSENQFLDDDIPTVIKVNEEALEASGGDIRGVFQMLQAQDTDFGKKLTLLEFILNQIRNVTGVQSPIIGELSPGDRTSALAMEGARESVRSAQETIRRHIARFVTNLGYLGASMMDHHWLPEQQIPQDGRRGGQMVNIQRPFTARTLDAVLKAKETGEPLMVNNMVLIPTTLHVLTMDGDEEVLDLDDIGSVDALVNRDDVEDLNIGFNYLPHIDVQIDMTLNSQYKEERRQVRDALTLTEQAKPGSVSHETWVREMLRDIPDWDYEQEIGRRYGEDVAQAFLQLREQGREQEALQVLTQMIQQGQMAQMQPDGAGGQLPMAAAPQPGQAMVA